MNKILKYLLCILLCILSIGFVVNTVFFCRANSTYLNAAKITANPTSEEFMNIAKDLEKPLNSQIKDLQSTYGEDYPALGMLYYKAISHYSTVSIIQNFLFSLIAGFALGNIIFFIFISKSKNWIRTIGIILGLVLVCIFLMLSNIYTSIANSEATKFTIGEFFWNLEVLIIPYTLISIVLIGFNKVYKTYNEIRYS